MINFWSFKPEYKKNRKKILSIVDKSLKSGVTFFGNNLKNFEKNFSKEHNSNFGIAVGSGTEAIMIALLSIGIKKGDEVITAANTAIPTISAIISSGAKPVLADIKKDYLINPKNIENLITRKTKAIIPVHLYGQCADMSEINKIAKKFKIKVVEDCAQAQGAKYKNKLAGTIGDVGCFSFYPTKILGAYGDGGLILTKNKKIFEKAKRIRFYGIENQNKTSKFYNKYYANENGVNSRLDEIQCGILNYKLKHVDSYIKIRRHKAKLYSSLLTNTGLILPQENKNNYHVYHLYTVYHNKRDEIIKKLNKERIGVRIIYPFPIQTMKAFKYLKSKKLKISENLSKGIFSLPLYPELSDKQIYKVANTLKKILNDFDKKTKS